MAKKKTPPKPISETRFDFADSLENLCSESILFWHSVDTVLNLGAIPNKGLADELRKRADAFRAALVGSD